MVPDLFPDRDLLKKKTTNTTMKTKIRNWLRKFLNITDLFEVLMQLVEMTHHLARKVNRFIEETEKRREIWRDGAPARIAAREEIRQDYRQFKNDFRKLEQLVTDALHNAKTAWQDADRRHAILEGIVNRLEERNISDRQLAAADSGRIIRLREELDLVYKHLGVSLEYKSGTPGAWRLVKTKSQ